MVQKECKAMLIRFKYSDGYVRIFNTENIFHMCVVGSEIGVDSALKVAGVNCSSQEQALKALDKIYTAYADGLRAITIEMD